MTFSLAWFDTNYPYRRPLQLTGPAGGALTGHNAIFSVPVATTIGAGKVRSDLADLLMVYIDVTAATPAWTPIPSKAFIDGNNIEIQFPLQAPLSFGKVSTTNYYLYYGNINLPATPIVLPYEPGEWAYLVPWDGIGVGYTRPGEHWLNGVSRAFGAKLRFHFYGTSIQVLGNKLPNSGIAAISIDNGSPTYVDYFEFRAQHNVQIFEQSNLDINTLHVLKMIHTGQKNPSSSDPAINVTNFNFNKVLTAIDLGEQVNSSFWNSA